MNDLARPESQRHNPAFRYNRHLLYNLTRPAQSLQLLAPLAKAAGGYGICELKMENGKLKNDAEAAVFTSAGEPDYQTLLLAIRDAKNHLDEIKRFDMPGFQPRPEYVREMKRYGILPQDLAAGAPVDVYATDRAYWKSLWHHPAAVE